MLIDRLVITCEHGGNSVPAPYRSLFSKADGVLESHRGYDLGALQLATELARRFQAPLIASTTTRLLVDLNRSLHNRAVFSEMSRRLDERQREHVVRTYYTPHRDRVLSELRQALETGNRVLHIGVHTFTPVLHGLDRDADVALLYDPKRDDERSFCGRWVAALKAGLSGLRVRRNYPYRGSNDGLTTTLRQELPSDRYLGVEVEVNQWLFERAAPTRTILKGIPNALSPLIDLPVTSRSEHHGHE